MLPLLRIHRFNPSDIQFNDAHVSSAVVWSEKRKTPPDHSIEFTYVGTLLQPSISEHILVEILKRLLKWSRFPISSYKESLDETSTSTASFMSQERQCHELTFESCASGLPPKILSIAQRGFQMHLIAPREQANMHGALPVSGLHEEQVYLIFLRCCSVTAATVLSSRSISIVVVSMAFWGHAATHFPHPSHLPESMTT